MTATLIAPRPATPGQPNDLVRLVLVDDHAVVRQGLRSVLEHEPDLRVVGEAGTCVEAGAVIAATRPSVVLLDLKFSGTPGLMGLELCEKITRSWPDVAVLVLTTTLDDHIVVSALRRGARGYVVKEVDTSELVRAIRTAHSGQNAFDPQSASAMVRGLSAAPEPGAQALTDREVEVLRLLAQGLSNGAIGKTLFVSATTAKFHVANILRKLDVTRRAEAVYVASKMGIL